MAAKLNKKKPYNEVRSLRGPERFAQNGRLFDATGNEIGPDPSYIEQEAVGAEQSLQATEAQAAAHITQAEQKLGDIGGLEQADKENAAALQAENAAE